MTNPGGIFAGHRLLRTFRSEDLLLCRLRRGSFLPVPASGDRRPRARRPCGRASVPPACRYRSQTGSGCGTCSLEVDWWGSESRPPVSHVCCHDRGQATAANALILFGAMIVALMGTAGDESLLGANVHFQFTSFVFFSLALLVWRGAGPLSLDHLVRLDAQTEPEIL